MSALLCAPRTGHAADIAPALDYDVQAGCPAREAFWALVREKLAAAGVEGRLEEPRVSVSVHAADSGFVGRLALQRADASRYEREVTGASCDEVTNALAFVLALALGAENPAPTPAVTPALPKASEPEPQAKPASPPAPVTTSLSGPRAPAAEARASSFRLGFGAQGGERAGLAPRALLFGSAFVQARRTLAPLSGASFRAGFALAPSVSFTDANGTTEFNWWAGSLELCPLGVRVLGRLEARPCAALDVGRLHVNGTPLDGPGSRPGSTSNVWVDALTALRLELPIFGGLSAELQGDLVLPLTKYTISFDPVATVYAVPALAAAGRIGLSAQFR
jgi:hypothetical protein